MESGKENNLFEMSKYEEGDSLLDVDKKVRENNRKLMLIAQIEIIENISTFRKDSRSLKRLVDITARIETSLNSGLNINNIIVKEGVRNLDEEALTAIELKDLYEEAEEIIEAELEENYKEKKEQ